VVSLANDLVPRQDAAPHGSRAELRGHLFVPVRMPTPSIRDKSDTQTPVELIFVALGSLLLFAPDHAQRVRLMKMMTEIELVAWNAMAKRYELTPLGRQRLAEYRDTTHLQF
jgi:hypothetical protein